jgi:exosortase/archaeosortase family protein
MKNSYNKINILKFVILFTLFYGLLLVIGINLLGTFATAEEQLIRNIIGNAVDLENYSFVIYCSGIVTLAVYLATLLSIIASKIKPTIRINTKWVIISIVAILLINILRVIAIISAGELSQTFAEVIHVMSWFWMGVLAIYLVLKTISKNKN